jgi:hypothetical protein
MRTAITSLLGVRHPIVGFNRSPRVVAEVTKAGGFGVLAASAYTPPPGWSPAPRSKASSSRRWSARPSTPGGSPN